MAASPIETTRQYLYKLIAQQNDNFSLENIRLEKINNIWIAVDVSVDNGLKGQAGAVYPAYPIDSTGKIHTDIALVAKIICYEHTPSTVLQKKTLDSPPNTHWQSAKPQKKTWIQSQIEARNDNVLFSSKAVQSKDGAIILMSKVPGISVLSFINTREFKLLQPIKRIYFALNALSAFEKLHRRYIFPRDITAGNTMVDLATLNVTPIDLGYSHETALTRAPEDTVTAQSNIYSIALDILIPIFSGVRAEKNEAGEITNIDKIKERILFYCIDPSVGVISYQILSNGIIALLDKMCSKNPEQRGTLVNAKGVLQELASLFEKPILDIQKQDVFEKQLRILETEVFAKATLFKIESDTTLKQPQPALKPVSSMVVSFFHYSEGSMSPRTDTNRLRV